MLTKEQRQNPRETLLNLLLELFAIQHSDYFVGTGGSNLTYLAESLMLLLDGKKPLFLINPRVYPIPGQAIQ
jgi:hypothetical protein